MNDEQLKELMINAARAAGKILLDGFGGLQKHKIKGDSIKSVVTEFDTRAEAAIIEILAPAGFSIIAEESGVTHTASEYTWVIDPLDGTSNFMRGLPLFSVSIGLLKNGMPEMGVIFHPANDELFFAQRGYGAFRNAARMVVSAPHGYATVGFDRGARGRGRNPFKDMETFFSKYHSVRIMGTSALGLAYVASNRTDAYLSRDIEPWDVAAGILIATEAGLAASDWQGNPWTVKANSLLVVKPELQKEILSMLPK